MGFGPLFRTCINLIYSTQEAEIYMVGLKSRNIGLRRAVWQGCPLSSLLLNIAIETLANAVRAIPRIVRIHTSLMTHKIRLYANDIVLFLQDPVRSMREVGDLLRCFGKMS